LAADVQLGAGALDLVLGPAGGEQYHCLRAIEFPDAQLFVETHEAFENIGGAGEIGKAHRPALKLFVFALIVFAVAFGLRRSFFWDVTPVSWDQEPQSLWALGAAFLLRSLENIAAAVAGLTLIAAGALRLIRRRAA
jgi:hypothetical protein